MTHDQRRKLQEAVAEAKNSLLYALRVAESSGASKAIVVKLGALCGKTESLQARLS